VIGRRRPPAKRALRDSERLVEDEAARLHRVAERLEKIPLQIACDDNEVERLDRQRRDREVCTPAADEQAFVSGCCDGVAYDIVLEIDAAGLISLAREQKRVPPTSHCKVERATRRLDASRQLRDPFGDKRRR